MHFLASIPRSGSTLLASLLNQRPDTYASPTSGLCDTMGAAVMSWEQHPATKASGGTKEDLYRLLKAIIDSRYPTCKIEFDKGRGWVSPQIIKTMLKVQKDVKIVATVRPIAECLASFVKIAQPKDVQEFCKKSELVKHLLATYHNMKAGYEAYPDNFLLVEYENLITNTQFEMDRVADFVGMEYFAHDLHNVPESKEQDEVWKIKNLHKVRKRVKRQKYDPIKLLGKELWDYYQGGEFWNDRPEPEKKVQPIQLQLEASLRGDFDTGWRIAQQLEKEKPDDDRAAFNRGWYLLQQGKLQEGHKLLDRGRFEDVFGNRHIGTDKPIWNGEEGTVLLNLEGGLGDQIHGFRYAYYLKENGNRVIISCSLELAPLFADKFPVVSHEAARHTYHDYWLPSMSAVVSLGHEYRDIIGNPYIDKSAKAIPGRVGVCWSGNPQFEHEQHRIFPPDLLFNAVKDLGCISLQHGDGESLKPSSIAQADVSSWEATRKSISECELVVTSCTSVAHLAGAMHVPTWIILPILPYYLWALPGSHSPYYNSVTLFRQTVYGEWTQPFEEIKNCLGIRKNDELRAS